MSRRSLPAQDGPQERKRAKRAARRPQHIDKYAPQRTDPDDRMMQDKLAALVARFNGQEANHE